MDKDSRKDSVAKTSQGSKSGLALCSAFYFKWVLRYINDLLNPTYSQFFHFFSFIKGTTIGVHGVKWYIAILVFTVCQFFPCFAHATSLDGHKFINIVPDGRFMFHECLVREDEPAVIGAMDKVVKVTLESISDIFPGFDTFSVFSFEDAKDDRNDNGSDDNDFHLSRNEFIFLYCLLLVVIIWSKES